MLLKRLFLPACAVLSIVSLSIAWTGFDEQPAPKVETLIPANPIVYLNWDGIESHQEGWQKTAAHEALYETGLVDIVQKLVGAILDQGAPPETKAAITSLYQQVYDQGFSMSVSLNTEDGAPPIPMVTLVMRNAADLEPMIGGFIREAAGNDLSLETSKLNGRNITSGVIPDSPGIELAWWQEGPHLVMAAGISPAEAVIEVADGQAANVTESNLWKSYRSKESFEVTSTVWLEFEGLRELYGELPLPIPHSGAEPHTINTVLKALGLQNFDHFIVRSGFKGRSMWTETDLSAPGERTGLLAMLDQKEMTLADLPPLPAETSAFWAGRVDWSKSFGDGVKIVGDLSELSPIPTPTPEALLQMANEMLGFDIQKEFFGSLGDVTCAYVDDAQLSFFIPGLAVAVKAEDPVALRKSVIAMANLASAQMTPDEVTFQSVTKGDRELLIAQVGGGFFNLTLAIDDGWLVMGTTPQAVESFYLRLEGKLPSWKPSDAVLAGMKELPEKFTSISVMDIAKTYRSLVGAAPTILGFAQVAINQTSRFSGQPPMVLPVSVADFPPAEVVAAPLYPNIAVSFADEKGFHWVSRTSAPGVPLTTAGSGAATVPVLVALLLPAVQQAREAARRTQSANNLKQMGLALHNYHDTHRGFPSGTIVGSAEKPEDRLSWFVSILPFLEEQAIFQQIDQTKGWQADENQLAAQSTIQVFLNPSNPLTGDEFGQTHYIGMAGVGKETPHLTKHTDKTGMFGYNRATQIRDIRDGTSNTIMVTDGKDDLGAWIAGGKTTIRPITEQPYINGPDGLGSFHTGGMQVLFADGSVRFISENIDPQTFESLITVQGAEVIGDF